MDPLPTTVQKTCAVCSKISYCNSKAKDYKKNCESCVAFFYKNARPDKTPNLECKPTTSGCQLCRFLGCLREGMSHRKYDMNVEEFKRKYSRHKACSYFPIAVEELSYPSNVSATHPILPSNTNYTTNNYDSNVYGTIIHGSNIYGTNIYATNISTLVAPEDVDPGYLTTAPSTKIVFNGPYDYQIVYYMKITNTAGRRIGWTIKTTNLEKFGIHPSYGVLDPYEGCVVAISCNAFVFGQQDTNYERIVIEWKNTSDGAAKIFNNEWFFGNGLTRRKNLLIEYNP
uniref:Major sperm protein n=1 Tax=Rhabditophanes sp. KR3021 TaxID=114890 RepID=A0AC35U9M9_9BILA